MDGDRGSIWIWVGLVCCAICFVAAFNSLDEFYYWRDGKKTNAWVNGVVEDETPQGQRVGYNVWYSFSDQTTGKLKRGSLYIHAADRSKFANGKPIVIEYFGGPFTKSRLQGSGNRFWPPLFVVSALATLACIIYLTIVVVRKSQAEVLRQAEADAENREEEEETI